MDDCKLPEISETQIFTFYLVNAKNNRVMEKTTGIGPQSLIDMYIRITNWRALYHSKSPTKLYLNLKTKHE